MDRESAEYKAARKAAKKERLRLKREEQKAAAKQERRQLHQTRAEEQTLAEHLCQTGDIEAVLLLLLLLEISLDFTRILLTDLLLVVQF